MGYIKEPKGVDFIIGPNKLTAADKVEISEFILKRKNAKTTLSGVHSKEKDKRSLKEK